MEEKPVHVNWQHVSARWDWKWLQQQLPTEASLTVDKEISFSSVLPYRPKHLTDVPKEHLKAGHSPVEKERANHTLPLQVLQRKHFKLWFQFSELRFSIPCFKLKLPCRPGKGVEWNPHNPRGKGIWYSTKDTHSSWGWMRSTHRSWGSCRKLSQRHFPSFTSSPG